MSALIESVATSVAHLPLWPRSALALADGAAMECLRRAGRKPDELHLLVNAGIYREKNLAEPALAAMIQEDVGANVTGDGPHGTFSFDIANGGAGVVTGLELVDGFIESGTIDAGIVVASDANPGGVVEFPFPSAGGAVLLGRGSAGSGFLGFRSATFPEFAGSFESHVEWQETEGRHFFARRGKNVLELTERSDYGANAVAAAADVVRELLAAYRLRPEDVELLVASAYPVSFAADLAARLSLPADRVASPDDAMKGTHTAGVVGALEPAFRSGRLAAARTTLFVAVGAGISVATALYRHAGGAAVR